MAIVHPKPEYRVEEYDGVFQIQRKETDIVTTHHFFSRNEVKEVITWRYVDKWGNCLYRRISGHRVSGNYDCKIKPFKDPESALAKIELMIKGEKYHYPKLNQ